MDAESEGKERSPLTREEMLRRAADPTYQATEEDVEYWRNASDEVRGWTLYRLMKMAKASGQPPEDKPMFPGFPKRR